jgi:hypothetical protein
LDTLPEQNEKEPNNNTTTAQQLSLPIIIDGTIGKPGDTDVFRFAGRAGQKIVAEVTARRLGSPLDSLLRLEGPAGELLASNDDFQDKGSGLLTHHADSLIHFTLPADGAYAVVLSDSQRHGGDDYGYRLRLSAPRPDFAVRVVPSSITIRPGMYVPITAFVLRKDGFTNEVRLAIKDGPPGVRLSGARIPSNQESIRLSLGVPPGLSGETFRLEMEAKAVSEQGEVSRPVVPAEDMTQAFAYHHLVPTREMRVAVAGRGTLRGELKLASSEVVKIPVGGSAIVRVTGPPGFLSERVQLALGEGPEGISIKETIPGKGWFDIVLESQAGKTKPGLAGNLIVNITRTAEGVAQKKKQAARPAVIGILPAIPFEVVPK